MDKHCYYILRLSAPAKEEYEQMAQEEIHLFNSKVEQRMAFAEGESGTTSYTEGFVQSKLSRSSLKWVNLIH